MIRNIKLRSGNIVRLRKCKYCKKIIPIKRRNVDYKKKKFCSVECQGKGHSIYLKKLFKNKENHPRYEKTSIVRYCKFCSKILKRKKGNSVKYFKKKKFCSYDCYWSLLNGKCFRNVVEYKKIKCKLCKKLISVRPNSNRKFCDMKCYRKWRYRRNFNNKKLKDGLCNVCNKKIRYGRKFCSIEHYGIYNSKKYKKSMFFKTIKCKYCGKKRRVRNYRNVIFCSIKCYWKWSSKNLINEKRYNWLGGISKEPYDFDFDYKLKDYIKKRDKFICKKCGKKTHNGVCHHIHYIKTDSRPETLVYLHRACNSIVNSNRNFWFSYFCYVLNQEPGDVFICLEK